jgi:hypothetical protein
MSAMMRVPPPEGFAGAVVVELVCGVVVAVNADASVRVEV